jgi:hypothetical protein
LLLRDAIPKTICTATATKTIPTGQSEPMSSTEQVVTILSLRIKKIWKLLTSTYYCDTDTEPPPPKIPKITRKKLSRNVKIHIKSDIFGLPMMRTNEFFVTKSITNDKKLKKKPDYSLELDKQCLPIAQIYLSSTNDRGTAQQ